MSSFIRLITLYLNYDVIIFNISKYILGKPFQRLFLAIVDTVHVDIFKKKYLFNFSE